MPTPEEKLKQLGIELGTPPMPLANYVPAARTGNLLFLSGHGPKRGEFLGKVGKDLTVEQGYQAARSVTVNLLASLKANLGELSRVKRIVKVVGFVNSAGGFTQQPQVVNGCSDLLVEVFGDAGKHARSAVGMAELPGNISVEIELVAEVE